MSGALGSAGMSIDRLVAADRGEKRIAMPSAVMLNTRISLTFLNLLIVRLYALLASKLSR